MKNHWKKQIVSLLCALLVLGPTAMPGVRHSKTITPDKSYLDFGAQPQFDAVVGLFGHRADGGLDWLGSAVVIDKNWVITGAHNAHVGSYVRYSIRTGASLYTNLAKGIFYSSSFAVQHPSYGGVGAGIDIALIRFDTPITGVPATLYTGTVGLGDVVSIAGFGGSAEVGQPIVYDYSKRGYQNVINNFGIAGFTDNFIGYSFVYTNDANFMPLGGLLWNADSGGGWFIDDGGVFKLAGISSSTSYTNGYGTKSFASTIDLAWVYTYVPKPPVKAFDPKQMQEAFNRLQGHLDNRYGFPWFTNVRVTPTGGLKWSSNFKTQKKVQAKK